MPAPVRKRTPPLEAAIEVLRRDGAESLSMRTVAQQAGVTPMALYRHFENKEALLRAVIRETYAVFRGYLVTELVGNDPQGWLRTGFDQYLRFALDHPAYYRLLFATPHGLGIDRYPEDFLEKGAPTFRQLRDVVARCMRDGVLRRGRAGDVALTLYAHMHGLVMLYYGGRFESEAVFRRFYLRSLDSVIEGLG